MPWHKVQRRIAQLMDEGQFLTPEEQSYADNKLNNARENTEEHTADSQTIMVVDKIPGVAAENYQQPEQTTEPITDNVRYLNSRVIITEFAEGEEVTAESLIAEAKAVGVGVPQSEEVYSSRIMAGKVLYDTYCQRIDPIDYFNRNYASNYDFTQACIIRGYIETAVEKDTQKLRTLPENQRMPRPFPITSREWNSIGNSNKEDSPYVKGLLLMRNHFAELMPVVIDDENGHELFKINYETTDGITRSVLAYSTQEAERMIPFNDYTAISAEPLREPLLPSPYQYSKGDTVFLPDGTEMVIYNIQFSGSVIYLAPPGEYDNANRPRPWDTKQYSQKEFLNLLESTALNDNLKTEVRENKTMNEQDSGEYQMEQARMEENLDKGTHYIIGQKISEPEQTRTYAVGDTVYLENNRRFIIDRIGGNEIVLNDPSLAIPVSRSIETADFEALLRENTRNSHLAITNKISPELAAQTETSDKAASLQITVPVTKDVVNIFSKSDHIYYTKHANGSFYISDSYFIMKTTEEDLNSLANKINSRRRKTADIEIIENNRLLEYIDNANGNYELLQKPYELGDKNGRMAYLYTDEKQYFEYDKRFVDIFINGGSNLFLNDNTSYDVNSHNLVVKGYNNSILGIVLPIRVPEELYEKLADIVPLKIKRKSEIERIKENPLNDPYIGKEFFDGKDNYIVSGIKKYSGVNMYTIPTIENGKVSGGAMLVRTDEIESQIERWEKNRDYVEQQKVENEIKAKKDAEIKAVYENTNGYADNLPPMQKANVLKALNSSFSTKDYGSLNVKQFIETAVKDGKTLESRNYLKKKYTEMSANVYLRELNFNQRTGAWGKYRDALNNAESEDSPNSLWLKENHPFLYYKLFNDITVLDNSYLYTEYHLMMDDGTFYTIPKTAFDYGNYLISNAFLDKQSQDETTDIKETPIEEAAQSTGESSYERYTQAKEKYPEHIVLTKLGDFYELHGADAQYAADTFGYTITARKINNQEIPLVGIPDKNADEFINRVNALGHNAALVNSYGAIDEYPSNGAEPDYKYERYTVATTSDAFDDPYIIWDNTVEDYYVTDDGTYATFDVEADAKEYCNFLAYKEALKIRHLEKTSGQRYIVEPLTDTEDIIIKSALINPILENAIIYGIKDTQTGTFLKNNDDSYEFYLSEMAASATAYQLSETDNLGLQTEPTPVIAKPQLQNRINFHINDEHLGEGGAKTKYGYNTAAIRLLKQIENENRIAAPAEQEILSRYVGWSGLSEVFDSEKDNWRKEYAELKSLLTPDEYEMARASTLNAHYTSPIVIKAIYETVERMGFKTGNILEPACGVGNFLGLLPESMKNSNMYGVELDSITGRIAKQLYQKADITISGFENTDMPDSFFDLAIGNVPFGSYKVMDKKYDKHNFLIHDYFFGKTLDQVRPGGIVAFVASKDVLDNQNPEVRRYIAQRAELLGAVRLPNNAFLKNAGTKVTSDILFLQKRDRILDIQPDWVDLSITEDNVPVNSYFADNPEMILGTMAFDEMMYGDGKETTCNPIPGADLTEQLRTALANIQVEITEPELDDIGETVKTSVMADLSVMNFSYALVTLTEDGTAAKKIGEGEVYYRENSRMYPVELPEITLERIKGMITLRNCTQTLINYQLNDNNDADIAKQQAELNRLYDDFTTKYGLINNQENSQAFSNDSAYYLLCSLELLDENGELARKADIFTKKIDTYSFETPRITPVPTSDTIASLEVAPTASIIIANYIKSKLELGEQISSGELFLEAAKAYGDTMANNAFTSKDAYDAMELGVNQYILSFNNISLENILGMLDLLPSQTRRTADMERFQQFSTPPSIAYLANWAANISKDDIMLEPSAGIGGIAVFAKKDGATVYVNELDKRRLEIIKNLPFDSFFNEDAEQINNIYGDKITPTVIVMNPPFSSSAERNIQNSKIGAKHIEEALKILAPNGRLIAIAGQGMSDDAPAFRNWWRGIKEQYNVKANIGIDGKNYNKYGTNFGIQMIVIDKDGTTIEPVKTAFVENLFDLQNMLGGIRNDRPSIQIEHDNGNEQKPIKSTRIETVTERESEHKYNDLISDTSGRIDTGINRDRQEQTNASELDTVFGGNSDNVPEHANVSDNGYAPIVNAERHRGNDGRNDGDNGVRRAGITDNGQSVGSVKPRVKKELTDSIFENYEPQSLLLENVQPHPANISESAAMSAIEPPPVTYKPNISQAIIDNGILSDVQLEAVTYAGQSHSQTLPNGNTRGFFLGDGTGVGKGRTITGVILDNYVQGRKKAVWLSENRGLIPDAKRDVKALFGNSDLVAEFEGGQKADKSLSTDEGILFVTYSALSKSYDQSGSNFEKIVNWLGKDFDGVIVFDEAHNMANSIATKGSRGIKKASQRGMAGLAIQAALPKAKIVYSSATGATEVENLRYAERLGLWGEGTAFPNGDDFVHKIKAGGLAAMELIARDMKAMGVYLSRNISYEDVVYDKIVHELTPEQRIIYDELARSWQIVLQNIKQALETTNQDKDGRAKGQAYSAFWGAEQRFFNQILTAMQVPSMIADIQQQLDNGNSIVIQLVSTNESAQEREFTRLQEQELDLEDFDLTPKQMLMSYIENSFPTVQFEEYKDDNGNVKSKPVYDSEGNAVLNREAVRQKEILLDKLGSIRVPSSPLDMIINHFGSDMVAENTGRKRRIVIKDGKAKEENIAHKKQADVTAFQNGDKRIIIFSKAGGTGKSYHADKSAKNQQHRVHYLLQAGWQADAAVQGFGRSHRSNQVSAPTFALVTTDLKGQMRFISTIAKRLDQLGALTKGQRQTGSQGLFSAGDNLENTFAADVLAMYYKILIQNGVNGISDGVSIIEKLGLKDKLIDEYGGINTLAPELREVNRFLNRILSLECHEQNAVFDGYAERLHIATEKAMQDGTLDKGLENYKADKVILKEAHDIRVDEVTGAVTKYYNLAAYNKIKPLHFDEINIMHPSFIGFFQNQNTDAVRAVFRTSSITDEYGNISENCRLTGQDGNEYIPLNRLENNWDKLTVETAEELWNNAVNELPEFRVSNLHLIGGTVLPVWDKLPTENVRIYRVLTSDGELLIGRVIPENMIDTTLHRLGASRKKEDITTEDLLKGIKNGDTVYLDNGWRIMQKKVSYEQRIEVIGANFLHSDLLAKKGVFTERINYQTRYFIPTVTDTIKILDEVIKISPVSRVENSQEYASENSKPSLTNHVSGRTAAQKVPLKPEKPSILAGVKANMDLVNNYEKKMAAKDTSISQ